MSEYFGDIQHERLSFFTAEGKVMVMYDVSFFLILD